MMIGACPGQREWEGVPLTLDASFISSSQMLGLIMPEFQREVKHRLNP